MNVQVLAQNTRRLRTAKKVSQKALAESAGLSLPAIKNIEGARSEPRMSTLQAIAGALDVKIQDLFLPVRKLSTVRFRSTKRMQLRENILADVARWLDDYNYLESLLNERIPFALDNLRELCSRDDIIAAAINCRKTLKLQGDEPIHNICGLLEESGVKMYSMSSASDGFFGLSVDAADGGPAVVVNVWERISVERRIFSAAHELGHLMLHREAFDAAQTQENKQEEQEADLFAGHFLMPDLGFRKAWDRSGGLHWVDRVLKVKRIFHVSYQTILMRLIANGAADKSIWKKFNMAFRRRMNQQLSYKAEPMGISAEPFGLKRFDFYEDRFSRLVRMAVESDGISLGRGAEMLRIRIEEMQELLRNWGTAP